MYIAGDNDNAVLEYNLSSAWNISTASYVQNFSVSGQDISPQQVFFKPDGLKMYVSGTLNDAIFEYYLTSAWNIASAIFAQSFSVAAQAGTPVGLFFKPDGLKMYVLSQSTDSVVEYNLTSSNQTYYGITDGTNWEIGLGTSTYGGGGSTLSRSPFESSNSNALVNWGAGDKDVFVTFPSENTLGTVPTADNSSVGTDLVAWLNLKKQLDAGVVNGVPYANNSTNGIVSTYSLVYTTTTTAYRGGVLAPNGDVHFVPYNANRGQKVSATGVVSTYSLVYTVASAYTGGVLAPNGDIHFVPYAANRGQKISASGVVSTYSLIYTSTDTYAGGVVASNGDIHFVPFGARVGQKVSAAGVVSTYSLVYSAGSYWGGVLAPNGDIHFVPNSTNRGQKISAAGVVSTYSLVFTAGSYNGGVLAPNGDIHFICASSAARGQKISLAGVVSTYSLVYTAGFYSGGVLSPNGDIHFVPSGANRGQKISATGVVSTYSLEYIGNPYSGGVITPNGDIHFVPTNAVVGQKISTNVQQKVGYALSPFFNKF